MIKIITVVILALFVSITTFGQQIDKSKNVNKIKIDNKVEKSSVINNMDARSLKVARLKNIEQYRIENSVPDDFPRYIDTGNPKVDLANYYNAKQKWIKKNPERFEKIKNLNL